MQFFRMVDKDTFIPDSQCHGCWWPGDERNRGISSYWLGYLDIAALASEFKVNIWYSFSLKYPQTSNISCTLGNEIVDHSDVVGALAVGAALTTSSSLDTWFQWIGQRQLQDETRNIEFEVLWVGEAYTGGLRVCTFQTHWMRRTNI